MWVKKMELTEDGHFLVWFCVLSLLVGGIFFLIDHTSPANEEALKQAKIDCPTIVRYVNLDISISQSDLRNAIDQCKQINIQKSILKN